MLRSTRSVRRSRAVRAGLLISLAIAVAALVAATARGMVGTTHGAKLPPASGSFSFLDLNTTPQTTTEVLQTLSKGACAAANRQMPLKTSSIPQLQLDQKEQLLAAQNALPTLAVAPGTPALVRQLIKTGKLTDFSKRLGPAAVKRDILPAAASVVQNLYGQKDLYALPHQLNIEGIWFNKKIFAANGISVPTTWDALMAAAAKLNSAGIQPFAADGKDGWPVTRFVGAYLFRDLGPTALQQVADGKAKLTDPAYVKAADAVATMGKDGYFGSAVASTDYNGAMNVFLTGKAAMMYMGSWALANFNDPKENTIGVGNIGFMKFPAVSGGKGNINQIPANVGQPIMMASKNYNAGTQAWLNCIASNYGDQAMSQFGAITGFKLHKRHKVDPLTALVQKQIDTAPSSVLWFEALFSSQATTVSQTNGGLLGNGSLSGQAFMQKVQAAIG